MSYPEDGAIETWERFGVSMSVIEIHGHYNGYVRFRDRPLAEDGYHGFVTYVPVHGGVTFAHADDHGFVYGFDCAHSGDGDPDSPTHNLDWVRAETERMAQAIGLAADGWERRYLDAGDDNDAKAVVIDAYHEELRRHEINFELGSNLGAMINVLGGKL